MVQSHDHTLLARTYEGLVANIWSPASSQQHPIWETSTQPAGSGIGATHCEYCLAMGLGPCDVGQVEGALPAHSFFTCF